MRLLTDCYVVGNRVIESDEQLRYMRGLYDYTVYYYRDDVRRIHQMMEHTKLKFVWPLSLNVIVISEGKKLIAMR